MMILVHMREREGNQFSKRSIGSQAALLLLLPLTVAVFPAAQNTQPAPETSAKAESGRAIPSLRPLDLEGLDARRKQQLTRAYERASSQPPQAGPTGFLAMAYQSLGKFAAAAQCYERARVLAPDAFRWPYYLAVVREQLNQRPEAIEDLRAAIAIDGDRPPAYVRLADLLRTDGDLAQAEKLYRTALDKDPDLATAHLGLGRVLAERGDWEPAVAAYSKAVAIAPEFAEAHYALGLAYRHTGDAAEAKASLQRYQQLHGSPKPTFDPLLDAIADLRGDTNRPSPGQHLATRQQRQRFAAELERVLTGNPEMVSAHSNLIALYWELGQPQKAEQHYRAALKINPNYAKAHYNWGRIELLRSNTRAAAEAFEKAIAADPHHADALVQSGLLLERSGNTAGAAARYQRALDANPVHRQAHYLMARYEVRHGNYNDAIEHLEQTIRTDDKLTPGYLRALAATYIRAGEPQKAAECLRDARQRAERLGLNDLLKGIDSDLARLSAKAGSP